MSNGLTTNQIKGMRKAHWTLTQKIMECDGMNEDVVNQDGKHWWYLMMQSMPMLKKKKKR